MLLLQVLLPFLAFATCTAKSNNWNQRSPELPFGHLHWYSLKNFGAKGPRSEKLRLVIPVGKVPKKYTNNVEHNLVFFAELGEYLPLEDKYMARANGYFDPAKGTQMATTNSRGSRNVEDNWINIGWPRIAKWSIMGRFRHKGEGRDACLTEPKMQQILNDMLKNFEQVSKTFKLNVNADDLGQKFQPHIQFGYVYWLEPRFLGNGGKGPNTVHPVIPLERVNDPRYPDHDLIFVAQISKFIPNLGLGYKGKAMDYFHGEEAQKFLSSMVDYREINIKFAQVAESVTFCYQRHWGQGRVINFHMEQAAINELSKNMREDWNLRSPKLKLDFNKDDLNQFDPSKATPVPQGRNDFKLAVGHVHWTKPVSSIIRAYNCEKFWRSLIGRGFGGLSRSLMVIPVGEVPDSPGNFFIAELIKPLPYLSEKYWKPTKDYFDGDSVIRSASTNFDIELNKRLVNTEWAVTAFKFDLAKHHSGDGGLDVKMNDKQHDIYKNMLKNYEERRKNGETNFSRNPPGNRRVEVKQLGGASGGGPRYPNAL